MNKLAFLVLLIALAASVTSAEAASSRARRVELRDGDGDVVGRVRLTTAGDPLVRVNVSVSGLPPGFHGFHVHAVGVCEPPFTSAGGHHNPAGASHPGHAGDLPVLYVTEGGIARAEFVTDRFTIGSLFDSDGSALIIHGRPDNYANIPTDRYDPDPDSTTLGTGDAGPRIACGVIEKR